MSSPETMPLDITRQRQTRRQTVSGCCTPSSNRPATLSTSSRYQGKSANDRQLRRSVACVRTYGAAQSLRSRGKPSVSLRRWDPNSKRGDVPSLSGRCSCFAGGVECYTPGVVGCHCYRAARHHMSRRVSVLNSQLRVRDEVAIAELTTACATWNASELRAGVLQGSCTRSAGS